MKNFLAPVMQNKVFSTITSEVGKFYISHESAILTGGTIGFSLATTAVTLKNAAAITQVINDTKYALSTCNSEEEKKKVYALSLKELTPLVVPIIIFQTATIGCAVFAKKQSDKRIAELAGALTVAQQAVSYYQAFQKETEEALGKEKFTELQKEIKENTVYEVSSTPVNSKQTEDDQIVYEPTTGQIIWTTPDRLDLAWVKYREALKESDDCFVPLAEVFFDKIGADYRVAAAEVFGYFNEDASKMDDHLDLSTTKVIVNGKEMAALVPNYYPPVRFFGEQTN